MSQNQTYAEVILPLSAPGTYSYFIPSQINSNDLIGKRVVVSFGTGSRLKTGIVINVHSKKPAHKTKDIIDILDDDECINKLAIDLWKWIASYYMCELGDVMNSALPGLLNLSSESKFVLNKLTDMPISELTQNELGAVNALENSPELSLSEIANIMALKQPLSLMKSLVEKEVVLIKEEIKGGFKAKKTSFISLNTSILNQEYLHYKIQELSRAPSQQKALLSFIEAIDFKPGLIHSPKLKKSTVLALKEVKDSAIKALIKREYLVLEEVEESRIMEEDAEQLPLKNLQKFQLECFEEIKELHKLKDVVLLHGVTSSGKTEIYAHLIQENIVANKQILYLVPEISLTNQLISRLKKYFGNQIVTYHSRMSSNERVEIWKEVSKKNSETRIVLGARSALFLPFHNLGLIIVDEEHDRSFKQQDPAPRYEARDVSVVLAKFHGAKVLMGSATPSLESYENAISKKYGYVKLTKRYGGIEMPEIFAVDLKEEYRKRKMKGVLSTSLYNEITEKLAASEQVILFQNRRGYAPLILCDGCGHSPSCINCDVTLTYHKNLQSLICHYCGYKKTMTMQCFSCKTGTYRDVGLGTQKVEEELNDLFPGAKVARFDLDNTRKKNAFQNLIDKFEAKEIDILVGTQMITKGLDFDNVGLVGIINADSLLKFPDFRSFERTYQVLTQVAGRAGRKNKRGKVVVQSFDPYHNTIQQVLSSNFKDFVESEFEERKLFKYPPFYRIIDVRIKHHNRQKLYDASKYFGNRLKIQFKEQLLGPEFHYIERIRNLYAMHFIIKIGKEASLSSAKNKLSHTIGEFTSNDNFKSIRVQIDVDPY